MNTKYFALCACLALSIVILASCKNSEPTRFEDRRPERNIIKEYVDPPRDRAKEVGRAVEDRDDELKRQLEGLEQ